VTIDRERVWIIVLNWNRRDDTLACLESLAQAAKSLFFMVPAALGVQEAGLIGAGHLFGLGADVALALSLAKRMREIVFGLPALVAWQWIEGRRIALIRGRSEP